MYQHQGSGRHSSGYVDTRNRDEATPKELEMTEAQNKLIGTADQDEQGTCCSATESYSEETTSFLGDSLSGPGEMDFYSSVASLPPVLPPVESESQCTDDESEPDYILSLNEAEEQPPKVKPTRILQNRRGWTAQQQELLLDSDNKNMEIEAKATPRRDRHPRRRHTDDIVVKKT